MANRNDPCPCGSGKKFKKCHGLPVAPMHTHATVTSPEIARADAVKELDRKVTGPLMRFAVSRLGRDWLRDALSEYAHTGDEIDEPEMQLAVPWALFHCPMTGDGATVARLFANAEGPRHPAQHRAVLEAHSRTWLGVWEVQRAEPGVGLQLTDLLTREERFVHEMSASRVTHVRDTLLARVVDMDGVSFLGGIHPQPLPPSDADEVVKAVRRACRVRTRALTAGQLLVPEMQLIAIDYWRTLTAALRAPRPVPTLTNTDGDPLVVTTDHFDIAAFDGAAVIERLETFVGACPAEPDEDDGALSVTITKPGNPKMKHWDNTVIGRVVVAGRRMRVETNSTRRADQLHKKLESHLGGVVRFRLREEADPARLVAESRRAGPRAAERAGRAPEPEDSPEGKAMVREFRERHMIAWLDEPIPALGGLTPRKATETRRSRKDLDLLLRDMENSEARLPADERIDVHRLRAELGM